MRGILFKITVILILAFVPAACQTKSFEQGPKTKFPVRPNFKITDSEVIATWKGGIHLLPASVTRSAINEDVSFKDETANIWEQRLTQEIVRQGAKVPAIIYVHGCKGLRSAATWGGWFSEFGFAFFAPDSFKRTGRIELCYQQSDMTYGMRRDEIKFALQQILKLPWIDKKRIVLVGVSEGGSAVARYSYDDGFIAHIILGYDCKAFGGGAQAPSGVAVLNLVGANDLGESLCSINRDVGGSQAISLPGLRHNFAGAPSAVAEIAKFLRACCGYKPGKAKANMKPEIMAEQLIKEFGDMATYDAALKAKKALSIGDAEGHKFWMLVHKIAMKLIAG